MISRVSRFPYALVLCAFAGGISEESAQAFAEMVRHGYVNCMTCHVSPSGGGLLTEYGRELSREVLSHGGKSEQESAFAYGAVKPPEWLTAGGDIRSLTLYRDSPTAREGRQIIMQADLEAAITYKNWLVDGTVGFRESRTPSPPIDHVLSRRHYVSFRPTDELSVRAGKFQAAFGINTPDHAISTKRGLGWDQGSETYNVEGAWLGEQWNVFATVILGRPDARDLRREAGGAVNVSSALGESYKVGASYFIGQNELARRHVFGPYGILGFTKSFFLLTEADLQRSTSLSGAVTGPTRWGIVNFQKIDYEVIEGLHGYLTQEYSRLDFDDGSSANQTYGIGAQFFPRPHLDLNLTWQIQKPQASGDATQLLFLMLHFYL